MTDFIIIDRGGTVYFFYTGEHSDNYVYQSKLIFTEDSSNKKYPVDRPLVNVRKIDTSYSLNLKSFGMPIFTFEGYRVNYTKTKDSLDFYITDKIAINSEQLHAFGQIKNVDWNYPIFNAHLPGIISNKQAIGKVVDAYGEVELTSYSPTTYFAQISNYKFIINESSDDWEEIPLPLLKLLPPQ